MARIGRVASVALLPVERADFAVVRQLWGYFVVAVAQSYAVVELLPSDHPGLVPSAAGEVGLWRIIRDGGRAWAARWAGHLGAGWRAGVGEGPLGRVGGTVDALRAGGAPMVRQTMAAAMGWALLASVWLWAGWAGLSLFISTAHAAGAAGGDMAAAMLGQLVPFLGGGSLLAQGLGKLASTVTTVFFALTAVSCLAQVVMIVADHHDNPSGSGRYSWWQLLLRTAMAAVLLAPIGGDWSGGHLIVGQLGKKGSDVASDGWTAMVQFFATPDNWVAKPMIADATLVDTVAGIVAISACSAFISANPERAGEAIHEVTSSDAWRFDYVKTNALGIEYTALAGGCGAVSFAKADTSVLGSAAPQVAAVHRQAFTDMTRSVSAHTAAFIRARLSCLSSAAACQPDPDAVNVGQAPDTLHEALNTGLSNVWRSVNSEVGAQLRTASAGQGWLGAGQWAQKLSSLQGSMAAAGSTVPRVTPPALTASDERLRDAVNAALVWAGNGLLKAGNTVIVSDYAVAASAKAPVDGAFESLGRAAAEFFDGIGAGASNLFNVSGPAVKVDALNPLASMSSIGHWSMGMGAVVLASGAVAGAAGEKLQMKGGGAVEGAAATALKLTPPGRLAALGGAAVSGLGQVLVPVGFALIVVGMGLAYVVPALPFVRFFFAVLQWLIAFVETLLLVPAMAFLMVSAEPGHLLPPMAKSAFFGILALFLRPILTLAGFVVGLMLVAVAIGLLNMALIPVMRDALGGGFSPLGYIAYSVIYFGVAYVAVNTCTKSAEALPQAAYRLLGANGTGERDDGAAMSAAIGGVVGKIATDLGMRSRVASRPRS